MAEPGGAAATVTGPSTGSAEEEGGDGERECDTSSSSSIARSRRIGANWARGGEGDRIRFGLGRVGFGGAAVPAAWGCRALRGIRLGLGTAGAARGALAWARPGGWAGAGQVVECGGANGRRRGWFGLVGTRPRRVGRQEDRLSTTFRPWYGTGRYDEIGIGDRVASPAKYQFQHCIYTSSTRERREANRKKSDALIF